MTSGREKMIRGRENCKNGREKKYNGYLHGASRNSLKNRRGIFHLAKLDTRVFVVFCTISAQTLLSER